MDRVQDAIDKHKNGYNCCQAVACAYADKVGIDEETMYKLSEGFGGGMGTMDGVCGAMVGVAFLAGMLGSDGNIEDLGHTKASTCKNVAELQKEFIAKAKRLICRDIKTGNDGKAFTSCSDCVKIAAEIAGELFE